MDGKISEQRVYCKIRAQLRFLSTEIHADLQKVYGNGALKYATICKWVRCFNNGRESIENDPRVGRPVSVLTEKNVATVKTLIEEDARYTMQETEELSGIHSSSVLKILRERLWLCKICTRWVPHLLTDEQKQSRVRLASQVIEKYDKCDPRRLEEIVTNDETWIYHFQPNSNTKNKVWVSSEGDRPVIAHRCKTSNHMLYVIFFDLKGPVLQIPVPKGSSVMESFTEKVFLLNLISTRNADCATVSTASNYSMIMHRPINLLR
jgi:histone-lysine N-methyltransferase SETMAR